MGVDAKVVEEKLEEREEEEKRRRWRMRRRRRRRRTTVIKSNNPHLAGGEKQLDYFPQQPAHSVRPSLFGSCEVDTKSLNLIPSSKLIVCYGKWSIQFNDLPIKTW